MFILSILPEWAIHLTLFVGVIGIILGFLLAFIPFVNKYKLPIQVISILILCIGVYLQGGLADYKEWERKVKEVEAKVAIAEAESARLNVDLQVALAEKDKILQEKGNTIVKYIDRYRDRTILKEVPGPERVRIEKVIEYVENCPIPPELVDIHNNAVRINQPKDNQK